jgi:hypothetical protein
MSSMSCATQYIKSSPSLPAALEKLERSVERRPVCESDSAVDPQPTRRRQVAPTRESSNHAFQGRHMSKSTKSHLMSPGGDLPD